jgi:hypothetical protein
LERCSSPHPYQNQDSGNSACLWRIHHALGDGISLATVAQHILEYADGSPFTSVIPPGMMEKRKHKRMALSTLAWKMISATVQVFAMPLGVSDDPTVFSKGMHPHMVRSWPGGEHAIEMHTSADSQSLFAVFACSGSQS